MTLCEWINGQRYVQNSMVRMDLPVNILFELSDVLKGLCLKMFVNKGKHVIDKAR